MEKSRKANIIHAATKAFARQDYHKVSTNEIVKEAGVSKGLLFHYFSSKESLLLHVYETALNLIHRDMFSDFDDDEPDVFERHKAMILNKRRAVHNNPLSTALIEHVHALRQERIAEARRSLYNAYAQRTLNRVYANFDKASFKHKDAIEEILNVSAWSFRRIEVDWVRRHRDKNFEDAFKILEFELSQYARFFRRHFYHA